MPWLNPVLIVYGLLTLLFGVLGFVEAKSVASLAAGGACGIIVLLAVYFSREYPKPAYIVAALVALLLLGRFAGPMIAKQQIYPAGIMVVASLVALVSLVVAHFTAKN